MEKPKIVCAPCGSWESPMTADLITRAGVALGEPHFEDGVVWWLERRPDEGGRSVVVQRTPEGVVSDITPREFDVRTRVHEYGGGAFTVHGGIVYFVNDADQRLYRQVPGDVPRPLTEDAPRPRSVRYADARVTPDGRHLVCVRETHPESGSPANDLVSIPTEGGPPVVLARGRDFYSSPRISPDGSRLAFLAWDHPNMPWDGTELVVADLDTDGTIGAPRPVAGGREESVFQPGFGPDGTLLYVSDRTGYWNLYAVRATGDVCLKPEKADSGLPAWNFGMTTWVPFSDGRIVLLTIREGRHQLFLLSPTGEELARLANDYAVFTGLASGADRVYAVAAGPRTAPELVLVDETGAATVLAKSLSVPVDPGYFSSPESIEFRTGDDETAHALFYPPANARYAAPRNELPPLVVMSHGGPTSATTPSLNLGIQYFTSRGIAVVDVNYRGSTGYGRLYRNALRGRWGIADTEDCVNAARHLAGEGRVDAERLAIRGGSAGGYTTLSALAFHDVFHAGVSRYGVADLEALAKDTHKFESRYLDGLVGPWPKDAEIYRERSPIHHQEGFSSPLLVLQGAEDPVVPPSQSRRLVEALAERGVPHAYIEFPGEQHGFRKAANIRRALEAELSFYGRVFGFEPADGIEPVNLEGA